MTTQRAQTLSLLVLSLGATLAIAPGCGNDSADGSAPSCKPSDRPELLTITELSPGVESRVANDSIVHRFRIIDAPGVFQDFVFFMPLEHTAGIPTLAALTFTITQDGDDLVYESAPFRWTTAPGRVHMSIAGPYKADDGCFYNFPSPLFAYDVDEGGGGSGEGGGGSGEGGGGSGEGGGGSGEGGG